MSWQGSFKICPVPRGSYEFEWLIERTQAALTWNASGIKALDSSGRTRGMVVYDNWTQNAVQAHMAVDSPIVWRSLLPDVFRYPFEHKEILLGVIPGDNLKSIAMVKALGFKEAWRLEDGWAQGVPLVFWRMTRQDCLWLHDSPFQLRKAAKPRSRHWYRSGSPLD